MSFAHHPLIDGLPEAWASAWGEDRFGAFTSFAVGDAEQRLRWIPPGRFTMGSPEGEAGRLDNEGPQHEVTLTEGYWMADTPVTQALWTAVMGVNPSESVSPERPVEKVTWEDCQEFIARLNARVRGLRARLPTEAEWEYACRAGTTTATWAGDLVIRGSNNAPILDEIAWYAGNSGVGFELGDGYDSRGWPEKQHHHERAGTRKVATRAPNPAGLYDMLGNVFEWCDDQHAPYRAPPDSRPLSTLRETSRVVRGGSWCDPAARVRAAFRAARLSNSRNPNVGLRLVVDPSRSHAK